MGAATSTADPAHGEARTASEDELLIDPETREPVLRVGNDSDVKQVASSLSFALADNKRVILRAVGAGAVSQMAKACAIARGYVATRGVDLVVRPGFATLMLPSRRPADNGALVETTAIVFYASTMG